jgi:cytochrome c-type biogenesis protein CcmE
MNNKLLLAVLVVSLSLAALVYAAAKESKKQVMTVLKLIEEKKSRKNIRLGARVADVPFNYQTSPQLQLKFSVRDQLDEKAEHIVPIVYNGPLPETLKAGRDVIVEGNYEEGQFTALVLQTQCPSKYEPPKVPGASGGEVREGKRKSY